jgi:hypothetical protein
MNGNIKIAARTWTWRIVDTAAGEVLSLGAAEWKTSRQGVGWVIRRIGRAGNCLQEAMVALCGDALVVVDRLDVLPRKPAPAPVMPPPSKYRGRPLYLCKVSP